MDSIEVRPDEAADVRALVATFDDASRRELSDLLHDLGVDVVAAGPVADMVGYVAARYEDASGCPDLFVVEACPETGCASIEVIARCFPGVEVCPVPSAAESVDALRISIATDLVRGVQRARAAVASYG